MKISCSKKLLDEMKLAPAAPARDIPPIYTWSAHVVVINRRKTLVCVNDLSRFGFVLYGLKAKDFKRLETLLVEEIRRCFLNYCVKPEIADEYLTAYPDVQLVKSTNRKSVARLNKAVEIVKLCADQLDHGDASQPVINRRLNSELISDSDAGYLYPNEKMFSELKSLYGKVLFKCQAADFMIKLNMERAVTWRRVVVPLHYTFLQLHEVIQEAFGWHDYHLYQFDLKMSEEDNTEISITPDMGEGYKENNIIYFLSKDKTLAEFIPKCSDFIYTYDLGDEWEHEIHVNTIIEDFDNYHPLCLMGEGDTPPEHVGGVYGYLNLLNTIDNPSHPDYEEITQWFSSQWRSRFDLQFINNRMEYL
jgi:hypothetical protein